MRVIAGEFRSRKLKSVSGLAVRPTPDRLRESLFSILTPRIAGCVFVDAYAGSGAVGIEALSRGAGRVILIEQSMRALGVIRENLASLGIGERVEVVAGPAAGRLAAYPADIVFIDPPYDQPGEYSESLAAASHSKLVIAQHASRVVLDTEYEGLHRTRVVKQGDNSLSFYEPAV